MLTTPSGSITFLPKDVDDAQSSAAAVVYVKKSGSTTDSLTLTRPGTDGPLTYTYVGSAAWQRTTVGSNSGSGSIDAIVYGIATPLARLPVVGSAAFDLDLIGAETVGENISPLAGTGTATIDFANGAVVIVGTLDPVLGTGPALFSSAGQLASGTNSFSGTFAFSDFGNFTGTLDGKLFGPAAQEIGASFQATGNDRAAVGMLLGRRSIGPEGNASFTDTTGLVNSQSFAADEVKLTFDSPFGAKNNDRPNTFTNVSAARDTISIRFDASTQTYTLIAPDRTAVFLGTSAQQGDDTFVGGVAGARSYVLVKKWSAPPTGNSSGYRFGELVYGMPTQNGQLIRTGRASYALDFSGDAADGDFTNRMVLAGSGALRADFVAGTLDIAGWLNFIEDYVLAGRERRQATATVTGTGTISATSNSFAGALNFNGIGNYSGEFTGRFYGPAAEELGGTFTAGDGPDRVAGAFSGKLDSSILAAEQTLSGLSEKTEFSVHAVDYVHFNQLKLSYDPANGAYVFGAPDVRNGYGTIDYPFGMTDIVASKSNDSQTYYRRSLSDGELYGYVFKPGPGNATLNLTYASFADLSFHDAALPGSTDSRKFVIFGIETPPALLPRSGSATYTGLARGTGDVGKLGYSGSVSGSSALSVDFAKALVGLSLNLFADDPARSPVGTFEFDGQLTNNGFFGGGFRGAFFGPHAEEFASVWNLVDDTPQGRTQLFGAAIGKKD